MKFSLAHFLLDSLTTAPKKEKIWEKEKLVFAARRFNDPTGKIFITARIDISYRAFVRSIIEPLYRNKERIETRLIRLSFGPINPPIISLLSNGTKAGSLRIIVSMTRQFPKFIIQTDIN